MVTTLGTCQPDAINAIEKAWPTTLGKTYDDWMQVHRLELRELLAEVEARR